MPQLVIKSCNMVEVVDLFDDNFDDIFDNANNAQAKDSEG